MRKRRRFFTLLSLTTIILIGLFCFSNLSVNEKVDLEIEKASNIYEIKENEKYASYNDDLIISSGSFIKVINKKGKELLQTKFYANELDIKTNNRFALLADNSGGEVVLLNRRNIACQITTEKIVFTRLLDNGSFVIGHASSVELYNSKGEKAANISTDCYLLDALVAKKRLVVSGFTTNKKLAKGLIIYYDLETGKEVKRFEYEKEIFPEIRYKSNRIVAISDSIILIQKANFEEAQIELADKTLKNYFLTSFGRIQCFFNEGNTKTKQETYSLNGELKNTQELDVSIRSFIYTNNGYSLIGEKDLQLYNSFGWLRKKTRIDKSIIGISKRGVYIIENGNVKYIKL